MRRGKRMSFANLILDILPVAIVAYGLLMGWRRGFVRVVFMKMRWLTALVVSFLVARPFGAMIAETALRQPLSARIAQFLKDALGNRLADATASDLVSELPLAMKGILNLVGLDAQKLAADADAAGGSLIQDFSYNVAGPISTVIGTVLVFLGVYLVLRLTLRFIVEIVSAIFSIPGLRIINQSLGVVFGLLFALITAWILVTVAGGLFEIAAGTSMQFFADFDIGKTLLAKFFYQFKPLELIFSL